MRRRLTGPVLGVMAAVALTVSGCSSDGTTPGAGATSSTSPSPSPVVPSASSSSSAADPAAAAALGQATAALGTTSFKLTLTSGPGVKLVALIDAPNSAGTGTLNITGPNADLTVKSLLVGQDLYAQVPGITKAGTWTHLDIAKLPAGADVGLRPGQIDPASTAQLLTSTTDVQRVDARSFKGTLDLTKATGITGIDKVTVDSLGTSAQNVPFTAGLDDQGRLSALTIQLPAVNGQQSQPLDVLYTDYGTKVEAQRPAAAEITEAPANLYTTLGG